MRQMKRSWTYADLEALPDSVVGELIGGELHLSPRPAPMHALATTEIIGALHGPFHSRGGTPGGWLILAEPELHFGEDALVPDVAGWRRERMPRVPREAAITLAPDWVCEILSPKTARLDLKIKLPVYAKQRVLHAWIVDPANHSLQVYRLEGNAWVVASSFVGDDPVRAEPFEAIEIDLKAWWD